MTSKHHTLDYCNDSRGVDNLLSLYTKDRDIIINAVTNNPQFLIDNMWTLNSPLVIDEDCKCKMGYGNRHHPGTCSQCVNLKRLIDFRKNVHKLPFTIQCGKNVGKQLMISAFTSEHRYLIWDISGNSRAQNYALQQSIFKQMLVDKYIAGDPFTIETLHTFMINKMLESNNLPHSVKLYTAFVCNDKGYMLTDTVSIGSLDKLYSTNNTIEVFGIILQLLVVLTELSKVNFSHGNPTIDSLLFDKQPVSYKYNNVCVQSRFTLKLTNFAQSSAIYNGHSYYTHNEASNVILERSIFIPAIVTDNNCWYKLTDSIIDVYQSMCRSGLSRFASSFDFYCFFVSLMMNKSFYQAVIADSKLNKIWRALWKEDELLIVQQRLCENRDSCLNIVKSLWLRCDILDVVWSLC